MQPDHNQPDPDRNQPDPEPTDRFRSDLGAIFGLQLSIPPEVDEAILADARGRLTRRRSWHLFIRIGALVTAAAAIVVLAIHFHSPSDVQPNPQVAMQATSENGVNIVDALRLARRIRAGDTVPSRDDFNHDGAVDQRDVDAIAMAAVKLPEGRMQ